MIRPFVICGNIISRTALVLHGTRLEVLKDIVRMLASDFQPDGNIVPDCARATEKEWSTKHGTISRRKLPVQFYSNFKLLA